MKSPRHPQGPLITFLLCILMPLECACAANFCVAPDGDYTNPGTRERPFASVQRAQQAAAPGDSVVLRGGIYRMKESDIVQRDRFRATLINLDKSGSEGNPISYFAMPGERPVFDCSDVKPQGLRINAFRVLASWVHLKGVTE